MKAQTPATKQQEIKHEWHLIDLHDQTLGRVATEIAHHLMGKAKPNFVRNLDCGDYVVVVNAKDIKVSGNKEEDKMYYRHSGYPGGFKAESLKELRARRPEEIIRRAVKGMLPQNRLRDRMLKRLFVFTGPEHTYQDKFKGGAVK
jgi:large subunit ribosomal protein L13